MTGYTIHDNSVCVVMADIITHRMQQGTPVSLEKPLPCNEEEVLRFHSTVQAILAKAPVSKRKFFLRKTATAVLYRSVNNCGDIHLYLYLEGELASHETICQRNGERVKYLKLFPIEGGDIPRPDNYIPNSGAVFTESQRMSRLDSEKYAISVLAEHFKRY